MILRPKEGLGLLTCYWVGTAFHKASWKTKGPDEAHVLQSLPAQGQTEFFAKITSIYADNNLTANYGMW